MEEQNKTFEWRHSIETFGTRRLAENVTRCTTVLEPHEQAVEYIDRRVREGAELISVTPYHVSSGFVGYTVVMRQLLPTYE